MNDHMFRVASARASSRGRMSLTDDTDGARGAGLCSAVPARRLMYGFGGGTYGLVYGAKRSPLKAQDFGARMPTNNFSEVKRRLNCR